YPLDFTFVCPTEITAFDDAFEGFKGLGAEVLGCSVDSPYSHLAWLKAPRKEGGLGGLKFPLLSDLTKSIARDYGVLIESSGIALRGLFIINPEGKVVYQVVHDLGVGRSVEETLRVLEAFQTVAKTGEVCPANWKNGKATLIPDVEKSKKYFSNYLRTQ
ncbi:MAG TPA: peroxiredoxin, partial [Bdellovibrionota bacterium]|nr:peroxiredoxin [Bdellovibrionota bacterium]